MTGKVTGCSVPIMAKEQTYSMRIEYDPVGEFKATTPNRALRAYFGSDLAESKGRYGRLKDGRYVSALLVHGGRRYLGGHEWGR